MDGSPDGLEVVRLGYADHAVWRSAIGMNGSRQIMYIPETRPVEAGLARQRELADRLTNPSSAPLLLVWRAPTAPELTISPWQAGKSPVCRKRWFRNRCGGRCVVTAASINVEEAPDISVQLCGGMP